MVCLFVGRLLAKGGGGGEYWRGKLELTDLIG